MRKLAIVGYGKMGRLIERLAPEFDFEAGAGLHDAVVAVDFSVASAVVPNVARAAAVRIPVVLGTTGWLDQLAEVQSLIDSHHSALVWSPNFSVGVNVFTRIVSEAARLFQNDTDYESWGWEIHHSAKKDAPSGTLLQLLEAMRRAGYDRSIDSSSNRAGAHPGTHEIGFDSAADTITLRHTARSREGFARGALRAAQWIVGRQGFYRFDDVLDDVLFGGR